LSIIAFTIAGNVAIAYTTITTIIVINWGTPLGFIGGYILIVLGFNQYFRDKKDNSSTPEPVEIQDRE
jgi:hypothetical protein